jgi:hypothetical protein
VRFPHKGVTVSSYAASVEANPAPLVRKPHRGAGKYCGALTLFSKNKKFRLKTQRCLQVIFSNLKKLIITFLKFQIKKQIDLD